LQGCGFLLGEDMNRLQELENLQCDLRKLFEFLNDQGPQANINIIDPESDLVELGYQIDDAMAWVGKEIVKEEDAECEVIDDNQEPHGVTR
jgi:hypothetical protein